jgi:Ca-activated chloride channel family protein
MTAMFGSMSVSGFAHPWFFAYLAVIVMSVGAYAFVVRRRTKVLRFANMELLQQLRRSRPVRPRHLPVVLLAVALAMLTVAMAGPTVQRRVPRERAVVMLVIDVSESMAATDVAPSRIEAAKRAGKQFADGLTPGISLGLVAFSAGAQLLVAPTTDRAALHRAIDTLVPAPRTATGEGIFTALQSIATVEAVMGGSGGKPPPARIVLESDGKETVPMNPDDPRGAFTAARAARDQGVQISTISFGTPTGVVDIDGQHIAVPVDDETLRHITEISGGSAFHADSLDRLEAAYTALQDEVGYQTIRVDVSADWTLWAMVVLAAAMAAAFVFDRPLPD